MLEILHESIPQIIETVGYAGLFAIIFMETGLPFGFIFPGDSLLFTAGLLSTSHIISLPTVMVVVGLAAVLGDSTGYWLGKKFGRPLLGKKFPFINGDHLVERTTEFYKSYGARALVFARFIPGVRTFVPIFAGIGSMPYRTFATYNIFGAAVWAISVPALGALLGHIFPQSEQYLTPIIIVILVVSTLPVLFEALRSKKRKK